LNCKNKTIIAKLIKYVSGLPEINNIFNKKEEKKPPPLRGSQPQTDLGLDLGQFGAGKGLRFADLGKGLRFGLGLDITNN